MPRILNTTLKDKNIINFSLKVSTYPPTIPHFVKGKVRGGHQALILKRGLFFKLLYQDGAIDSSKTR